MNILLGFVSIILTFTCIVVIEKAKNKITKTFANSPGWNENAPILNQLVAPLTGVVNKTAINKTINIPIEYFW